MLVDEETSAFIGCWKSEDGWYGNNPVLLRDDMTYRNYARKEDSTWEHRDGMISLNSVDTFDPWKLSPHYALDGTLKMEIMP